ncbi:MAG: DUF3108 domain-containing protein [Rhodospirillaceae bacterium]|nr:DUF3108 domain-containing protein [Rhodospirillaceae bacterium]
MRYFSRRAKLGILGRRLGVLLLAGLAGVCLGSGGLGSGGGARAAQPVTLSYTGYMAGLPVFSLTATIDFPAGAGTGAMSLVPGNGGYSLNADAATAGNFRLLYPYRATVVSSGQLSDQTAAPRQFRSVAEILGKQEAVTLTYGQGGRVGIEAIPMTRQAQDAMAQGFAHGTMDPASAVVAAVAKFAATHQCAGTYKLFDGVRRYDLTLRQGGYVELPAMVQSYYDGGATECSAEPLLLEGFSSAAAQSQFYPRAARLFLAPAVTGLPAIPVRIEAQNALGMMTLDLTGVQF